MFSLENLDKEFKKNGKALNGESLAGSLRKLITSVSHLIQGRAVSGWLWDLAMLCQLKVSKTLCTISIVSQFSYCAYCSLYICIEVLISVYNIHCKFLLAALAHS